MHWTYHVILNAIVFPYSFLILEELHLTQRQKTKIYHQYHQSRKTSPKLLLSKFSPPQLPSVELNTQHFCQCIHRICVFCSTKYTTLQFFVFVGFLFFCFFFTLFILSLKDTNLFEVRNCNIIHISLSCFPQYLTYIDLLRIYLVFSVIL